MEIALQFPPTPECAHQHADLIVKSAKEISGVDLDYTPESLAAVDDILGSMHDDGVTVDQIGATLFCFGCYVGEVFVRNHGGQWRLTEETAMKEFASFPIVMQLGEEDFCNPIDKTFKRIENGDEDNLPFFYRAFTADDAE